MPAEMQYSVRPRYSLKHVDACLEQAQQQWNEGKTTDAFIKALLAIAHLTDYIAAKERGDA